MDIVITHCKRNPAELRADLAQLVSLESVSSRRPCLHIYTKSCYDGAMGELDAMFPEATSIVRQLNMGREGASYLEYILKHYHNLPQHVMFLQDDFQKHLPNMMSRYRLAFR